MSDINRQLGDMRRVSREEWPYPTITTRSIVTGDLREKILRLYNLEVGVVHIVETSTSEGYSDATQEERVDIEIRINGNSVKEFLDNYSSQSAISRFLHWIDENE